MHWILALTLATQVTLSPSVAPQADSPPVTFPAARGTDTDPADSLLRAASEKMSRGDYRGAAVAYRSVARSFPNSMRISEAMYFEAFALYRAGDFPQSLTALDALRVRYPQASARGDANSLRARVCGELARQGDSACAEEVTRVSASAAARSARRSSSECPDGDEEDDTRIAALNALLQMDASRAMPILTNVLARRDACSERLRRKAVFLVAQKQTRESADVLLAAAKNDPDNEVREQAVFWLSQVKDPRAVEMLTGIITSGGSNAIRERALFALSQHNSPEASAALRRFAENESQPEELRERAIFSLGQARGGDQTTYLRTLYRTIQGQELKEKILFALSQRRGVGNDAFLLGIISDAKEPEELRKRAIFWASQMGIGIAQLGSMYRSIPDRELREQVIFAISQRNESAAIDMLMEIAKSDQDRELRKKAIFWLGQSRDPRATQFLSELISK